MPAGAGGVFPSLAAGSRVAGYRLEEQLGTGGMAVVFRARDERLGRLVALKVLARGLAADEGFRRRFLRESRAAAAVDDPHIIPVYEAGEAGGALFIAMRYVSGGDVRGLVRLEGPLPAARAAAIISPVASALDAAHAAGLVHRDVKPANMLVDAHAGRPDHVYLSDFGLATGGPFSGRLTRTGLYLGTVAYMAPEQIQGREVDGRADQYALACAAFELLAGVVPFEREEDMAVLYAHLSAPPPPLSSRRPGVPAAVDGVLGRALAKAPQDRYPSCREFAEALRRALGLPGYDHDAGPWPAQAAPGAPVMSAAAGGGPEAAPRAAREPGTVPLPGSRPEHGQGAPGAEPGPGTCAVCGQVNPEVARFCLACGAPIGRAARPPAEERKTVAVLFCDLVASGQADPEDVRARIRPYHARLRTEIEGFGGTVEKFIGDAVMAVFGAPVAHEDDPERAVRAGLRILDVIADLNEADPGLGLAARVGVESGEAMVALDARPERGEGLVAGDVVNMASRLQGVAPVDGVLVGLVTYGATRHVFDYEALDQVVLQGKAGPFPVFRAVAPRARLGTDVTRSLVIPMVGRQVDLGILTGAFRKAVGESTVQLVVVAGEPGVGKSRLVAELLSFVDSWPELVRWRQGRCLPYGQRITFWALGEIVKAEAGILESDPPEAAAAKIDAVIPDDAPDAPSLRARLRPLAGLAAPEAAREENFAAWRAFLELLSEHRPSVLVFEDLHWADDALLEFIEQLAGDTEGAPLLLVATARPELYERAPGWAASVRNLARVNLRALTQTETAQLIGNLLGSAVLPAEVHQAILDRSGGNPLYAEQFVQLLQDRQILTRAGAGWRIDPGAEIPLPPGLQRLIAARLDTLTAERKRLLHDASVVGKVFWSGAVAEIGGCDEVEVRAVLHELARAELVRPARRSSMAGQAEYVFAHALIREVCYGQIPRADRARRHQRAAAWIEAMAGDRAADHAEILAAHYTTALELARAAKDPQAEELTVQAVRYLMLAGDRAIGIDVQAAERHYASALQLTGSNHPQRPELLARHADALRQRGRAPEAVRAYEQAIEWFRARRDVISLAQAMNGYGLTLQRLGDARSRTLSTDALALLEPLGPSPQLVQALSYEAATRMLWGDNREAIEHADRALALAAQLGLPEPARARGFRGAALVNLGDAGGLEDMRKARDAATAQGLGRDVAILYLNLAERTWLVEGPRQRLELAREGSRFARRRGIEEVAHALDAATVGALAGLGSLEEAMGLAEELAPRLEETGNLWDLVEVRSAQARALHAWGEHVAAVALGQWIAERARESANPQILAAAYPLAAALRVAHGDAPGARALLAELSTAHSAEEWPPYAANLGEAVRAALAAGAPELAAKLADTVQARHPLQHHAVVTARALLADQRGQHAEAAGLFADAADRWERFEVPWERAQALLGRGRCLLALGRPTEAREPLRTARDVFTSLGARPAVTDVDRLLAQATAATA